MAEETEKKPVDYIERTLSQVETVHKAADRLTSSEDKESADQLEIEIEKLCFYQNSAKGNPKVRAEQTAERVRALVLGNAITQPLPN